MSTNRFANASRNKPQKAETSAAKSTKPTEPVKAEPVQKGSRASKKAISAYFDPKVSQAFKILAAEREVTVQALLGEAIDDIFKKYRKVPFGER